MTAVEVATRNTTTESLKARLHTSSYMQPKGLQHISCVVPRKTHCHDATARRAQNIWRRTLSMSVDVPMHASSESMHEKTAAAFQMSVLL